MSVKSLVLSTAVLAVFGLGLEAQKGQESGGNDTGAEGCHCHGSGIRCLFGSAAPCKVTCDSGCYCEGGRCVLGIPIPPLCGC